MGKVSRSMPLGGEILTLSALDFDAGLPVCSDAGAAAPTLSGCAPFVNRSYAGSPDLDVLEPTTPGPLLCHLKCASDPECHSFTFASGRSLCAFWSTHGFGVDPLDPDLERVRVLVAAPGQDTYVCDPAAPTPSATTAPTLAATAPPTVPLTHTPTASSLHGSPASRTHQRQSAHAGSRCPAQAAALGVDVPADDASAAQRPCGGHHRCGLSPAWPLGCSSRRVAAQARPQPPPRLTRPCEVSCGASPISKSQLELE